METMNQKIKRIRKSKGLKQTDVCELIGITQPSFASIEAGRTKSISIELGKNISKVLGVDFNELFEISNNNPSTEQLKNEIDQLNKIIQSKEFTIDLLKRESKQIKFHIMRMIVSEIDLALTRNKLSKDISSESIKDEIFNTNILIRKSIDSYVNVGILSYNEFDEFLNNGGIANEELKLYKDVFLIPGNEL